MRQLMIALAVGTLAGGVALGLGELALLEGRGRAIARLASQTEDAASRAASRVTQRVLGAQGNLAAAAQGLLVQYGAARRDKAVLAGILADLRPLVGPAAEIRYVFAIDQSGAMLAVDPPLSSVPAPATDAAWSVRVREGKAVVSAVLPDAGGAYAVVVAVPVRDGFGVAAGALAASIEMPAADIWLSGVAGAGSSVTLVDADGGAIGAAATLPAAGHLIAESVVSDLGWRVRVALPTGPLDHELAPLTSASRASAAVIALVAFAAALWSLLWRGAAAAARSAALEQDAAIAAASRHRAVYLDRFGQALRAPLNSIAGFSGLLAERLSGRAGEGPEQRWLRNIRAEIAQLVSLTADASGISLLDAGTLELRPREIGVAELMAPVDLAADSAAKVREVSVAHVSSAGLVHLDVERVRRIAGAIVDRAVRHAPPGSRVTVTAGDDLKGFTLVVESSGAGLPADRLSAVREGLAGLPDPSDEPGAGLSLALAARLAALHGGSISYAESDDHTGSFQVRIPRAA